MVTANTMYFRATLQKTPSGRTVGMNILAGFDPKLVYATAAYKESASCNLTTGEIDAVVAGLAKHSNAASVTCLTSPGVQKLIDKNDEDLAFKFN